MNHPAKYSPFRFGFSLLLSVATFLLIIAGGLVTSKKAGLSVPDWPLSYGQMFPPMVGNIFWEHGHRMIAGTVGILTLVLMLVMLKTETRPWVKKLSVWMLLAVALQAVLGGITVLMMLPPSVSIFHACLGQTFLCLTAAMAYAQSPGLVMRQGQASIAASSRLKSVTLWTFILIYLQLILGASVRHTGTVPFIITAHIATAVAVLAAVMIQAKSFQEIAFPGRASLAASWLGLFVMAQVVLGLGALTLTRMMEQGYEPTFQAVCFASGHQSLGALILTTSFWLMLRVRT